MPIRRDLNNAKGKAYYVNQRARYLSRAREAMASGDRISYEYNLQYAEHFNRVIAEKFPQPVISQPARNVQEDEVNASADTSDVDVTACDSNSAPQRCSSSTKRRKITYRASQKQPAE